MEIVYHPKGGEEQVFEIDIDELTLEEFGLVENYSGKSYSQLAQMFASGSMSVSAMIRPFLFIYLRRQNPEVHYRDVNPRIGEVQIRPSLAELLETRDRVLADPKYPSRKQLLKELEDDIAEARARGERGKEEPSPAPTSSSEDPSPEPGTSTESNST